MAYIHFWQFRVRPQKALQETNGSYLKYKSDCSIPSTSDNKSVARVNDVYQHDQQKLAWVLGVN